MLFKFCFSVIKTDGVIEGGAGIKTSGRNYTQGKSNEDLIGNIGFGEKVEIDNKAEKNILITGAGSYIGESFKDYAKAHYPSLVVDSIDMIDGSWKSKAFQNMISFIMLPAWLMPMLVRLMKPPKKNIIP